MLLAQLHGKVAKLFMDSACENTGEKIWTMRKNNRGACITCHTCMNKHEWMCLYANLF